MTLLRILSLGAGVQSTTLFLMACHGHHDVPRYDAAVFADTQEEPQTVYQHLQWLQTQGAACGIPILTRTRGKLGDDLILGRVLRDGRRGKAAASIPAFTKPKTGKPGVIRRQCTMEYKIEVVNKTVKYELVKMPSSRRWPEGVVAEIHFGISLDEASRAAKVRAAWPDRWKGRPVTPVFPLVELGWTRADCRAYLAEHVPHHVPRSACVFCPYRSDQGWAELRATDPEGWERAVQIDYTLRARRRVGRAAPKLDGEMFLHSSRQPLDEVDFSRVRLDGPEFPTFVQECEGMCGV